MTLLVFLLSRKAKATHCPLSPSLKAVRDETNDEARLTVQVWSLALVYQLGTMPRAFFID